MILRAYHNAKLGEMEGSEGRQGSQCTTFQPSSLKDWRMSAQSTEDGSRALGSLISNPGDMSNSLSKVLEYGWHQMRHSHHLEYCLVCGSLKRTGTQELVYQVKLVKLALFVDADGLLS